MKIVIVGGVAGGASFAARMRRLNEDAEIILFEKGEYVSFANCGLPYYIGDTIEDRDMLLLQTVEQMSQRFNMKVNNNCEVTGIDRENKTVTYKDINNNKGTQEYDYLILSPGAHPVKPPIEGIKEADNIFTLRTIPDTDIIKNYIEKNNVKKSVVVGGGFIGLEMAENLHKLGIDTAIVEMSSQVMAPLDFEMAQELHMHIEDMGVKLVLNNGVKAFKNNGKIIELSDGTEIESDLTVLSIGVSPESSLAKNCGLETNSRGAIVVDDFMKTSDPSIFAIGDAVEVKHFLSGDRVMIPLAGPANYQGRMVADELSGLHREYMGSLGTSIAKVFDLEAACTGLNEKSLKGREYNVMHLHPKNIASYYPGSVMMNLKVIFDNDENILGAQCVATDGADKVIDVISTAISAGMKITKLKELQLAYAPPFNSAKAPANFAGYVAENMLNGFVKFIQYNEIQEYTDNGYILVDVSNSDEFNLGNIKNSLNIPLPELRKHLDELKGKKIALYCRVSLRGYVAYRILRQHNIECVVIDGGFKTYSVANYKVKGLNLKKNENNTVKSDCSVNVFGQCCPKPINIVTETIEKMKSGEILEIISDEISFTKDIANWCNNTGNKFIDIKFENSIYKTYVEKA